MRGTMGLLVAAVMTAGCPQKAECDSAADCGPLEPGATSNAPARAPKYCTGGTCTDPPGGTTTLVVDLTTPRNVAVDSIRYAVVDYKAANVESACEGRPNCPAATATCDDIKAEGLEAPRFNVALGGVKNTPSQGGTQTVFQGITLGSAPQASQYLVIDGRSGQLGAGDRLAWACVTVTPSGATHTQAVTLLVP
ncbi:MAG: hypothetical protein HY904_24390 [Deltaproteobacteria bacterium]|nr:hypothetical protein [Deltaproteobacteria bacterium]